MVGVDALWGFDAAQGARMGMRLRWATITPLPLVSKDSPCRPPFNP